MMRVRSNAARAEFERFSAIQGGLAELADAPDLGSGVFGRAGSSPATTISNVIKRKCIYGIQ